MNILAMDGAVGFRRRHLRAVALGFVLIGTLSLVTFLDWADKYPWTVLRYPEPSSRAVEGSAAKLTSWYEELVICTVGIVAFATPHIICALAGGCLLAKGRAAMVRCQP